jgi:hypothetical protein
MGRRVVWLEVTGKMARFKWISQNGPAAQFKTLRRTKWNRCGSKTLAARIAKPAARAARSLMKRSPGAAAVRGGFKSV